MWNTIEEEENELSMFLAWKGSNSLNYKDVEACAEITMCTGDRITYPQQGCNMEISVICIDQKLVLVRLVTLGMLREERRNL